jgi:hypothetical protein
MEIELGWANFTRTVYNRIAKKINCIVTSEVIAKPYLVIDLLLFGEDEFQNILFKNNLSSAEGFIAMLKSHHQQKPYSWISGKTLQAYWNNCNAKEKKLHVLLTFLGVAIDDWEEWKQTSGNETEAVNKKDNGSLRVIKENFSGCYYRYFQKTDRSAVLIKTPFLVSSDEQEVVSINTKTIGHKYKSNFMTIRDGAWYIECENLDWNEKESFIFNVGFQINPKVIMGVSNTLNRRGQATAIKNILVRQDTPFNYSKINGLEIPFEQEPGLSGEEQTILNYFKSTEDNIIRSTNCSSLQDLIDSTEKSFKLF